MPANREVNEYEKAEIMEEIAQLRYNQNKTVGQIAKKLGFKLWAVSRLLDEARESGVVAFDIDKRFGMTGTQRPRLIRQLEDEFKLEQAIVVQPDDLPTDQHLADDYLHTALANQTGKDLKSRIRASPENHIAVGSGRAVYQTVRFIRRCQPLKRDVTITPITGRIWTHSWKTSGLSIERPLDADDAAFVLALAFENESGMHFSQVTYPLFASSQKEARSTIEKGCPFLPGGKWGQNVPNLAVVGIGAVNPNSGHRFADLYRDGQRQAELDRYLSAAAKEIKSAIEYARKHDLPYFADISNRLFTTLPLPDELVGRDLEALSKSYDELINRIERLNEKMIVVGWNHLQAIRHVCGDCRRPIQITGALDNADHWTSRTIQAAYNYVVN